MKQLLLILLSGIFVLFFYRCRNSSATVNDPDRRMIMPPDSPYAISAFINDADDPVNLLGIEFNIGDAASPAGDLRITTSSSNTAVVPDKNLIISGRGITRNLKIIPVAAGYSTITINVVNGSKRRSYILNYAASQAPTVMGKRWHGGIADASAAVIIDNDYMLVGNDESNNLYLYDRNHSGLPVASLDFNYNNALALTDSFAGKWKEVDVEAGVRSIIHPSVIYWIGSMSNNGTYLNKPNRNRLFAVNVSGKAPDISITNAGYYSRLREQLIAWGNLHGYDFGASAAPGKDPKTCEGFNIEGMAFGPDDQTLYIAFRAPLVSTTTRRKAVIAPIKNFESWFNNGAPAGDPEIGAPIELDLRGRGFRDIIRRPDGSYVIIGGSCGPTIVSAVFTWSGKLSEPPAMIRSYALTGLNVEGVLPVNEGGRVSLNKIQVLTDNGTDIFYGDTVLAKNLPFDNLKKFSSVITEPSKQEVLQVIANAISLFPRKQ